MICQKTMFHHALCFDGLQEIVREASSRWGISEYLLYIDLYYKTVPASYTLNLQFKYEYK